MKRIRLVIFLFSLMVPAALFAETVLLYTSDEWISPEIRRGAEYIVPALEDGIMETLFDAGHIIFNDRAPSVVPKLEPHSVKASLLLAKKGGAQLMVELRIVYDPQEEWPVPLPAEVVFTITNVKINQVLLKDRLFSRDFRRTEFMEQREICRLLGVALAQRVLSEM